jgi:hypothetical protein
VYALASEAAAWMSVTATTPPPTPLSLVSSLLARVGPLQGQLRRPHGAPRAMVSETRGAEAEGGGLEAMQIRSVTTSWVGDGAGDGSASREDAAKPLSGGDALLWVIRGLTEPPDPSCVSISMSSSMFSSSSSSASASGMLLSPTLKAELALVTVVSAAEAESEADPEAEAEAEADVGEEAEAEVLLGDGGGGAGIWLNNTAARFPAADIGRTTVSVAPTTAGTDVSPPSPSTTPSSPSSTSPHESPPAAHVLRPAPLSLGLSLRAGLGGRRGECRTRGAGRRRGDGAGERGGGWRGRGSAPEAVTERDDGGSLGLRVGTGAEAEERDGVCGVLVSSLTSSMAP